MAWAAWACHKDIVQFLISKGVLPNKGPITTMRQVIKLAFSVFIFELLFRSGNCINAKDGKGCMPLSLAEE